MTARRNVLFTRQGLARAGALILAALLLAAGLELLIQRTLPPIYPDQEMDLSSEPTLIERGTILTDASGRRVLKEEWDPVRFIATFFLRINVIFSILGAAAVGVLAALARRKGGEGA